MEPEGSLPCSQKSSTSPYPEPDQFSAFHPILSLYLNIILPVISRFFLVGLSFWLSYQNSIRIHALPHSCYMSYPSHTPWFDHCNFTRQTVRVTKLLSMQFSPISRHYLRFKYSPQHPVFKPPQSMLLLLYQRSRIVDKLWREEGPSVFQPQERNEKPEMWNITNGLRLQM
jgi:hypothetical protein